VVQNEKINEAHELVLYNADGTYEVVGVRSEPSEISIPKGSELYVQSKSHNRKLSAGAVIIKGAEGGSASAPGPKKGSATKKAAAAASRRRPAAKDEEECMSAVVAGEEGAKNTSARQGKRKTRDDEMNNMPSASKRGPAPGTVANMTRGQLPVEIIASVLAVGPLDLNLLQASLLVSKSWRQATESAMQLRARALLKLDGPGAASISKVIGSHEGATCEKQAHHIE
jgi:hypothetical protein